MSISLSPKTRNSFFRLADYYRDQTANTNLLREFEQYQRKYPAAQSLLAPQDPIRSLQNLADQIRQNPAHPLSEGEIQLIKIFLQQVRHAEAGAKPFDAREWVNISFGLSEIERAKLQELEQGQSRGQKRTERQKQLLAKPWLHYQDAQSALDTIIGLPLEIHQEVATQSTSSPQLSFLGGKPEHPMLWRINTLRAFRSFLKENGFYKEAEILSHLLEYYRYIQRDAKLIVEHDAHFFIRSLEMIRLIYPRERSAEIPLPLQEVLARCQYVMEQTQLGVDYAAERGLTEFLPQDYRPKLPTTAQDPSFDPLHQNFAEATPTNFRLNSFQAEVLDKALRFHKGLSWNDRNALIAYFSYAKSHPADPAKILTWMIELQKHLPENSLIKARFDTLWKDYQVLLRRWGYPLPLEVPKESFKVSSAWKHSFNPRLSKININVIARSISRINRDAALTAVDRVEVQKVLLFFNYYLVRLRVVTLEHLPYLRSAFTLIDRYLPADFSEASTVRALLKAKSRRALSLAEAQRQSDALKLTPVPLAAKALASTSPKSRKITLDRLQELKKIWEQQTNPIYKRQRADDLIDAMLDYRRQENPQGQSLDNSPHQLLLSLSAYEKDASASVLHSLIGLFSDRNEIRRLHEDSSHSSYTPIRASISRFKIKKPHK